MEIYEQSTNMRSSKVCVEQKRIYSFFTTQTIYPTYTYGTQRKENRLKNIKLDINIKILSE